MHITTLQKDKEDKETWKKKDAFNVIVQWTYLHIRILSEK